MLGALYFLILQFPNAVVLDAVGCRNIHMSANERKRVRTQERKRVQKGAQGAKERFRAKIVNNQV